MRAARIGLLAMTVVYLAAVFLAFLSAISPDANHPGVYLLFLTLPWGYLLLPPMDAALPHAPQWLFAAGLAFAALLNVGIVWFLFRWLTRERPTS